MRKIVKEKNPMVITIMNHVDSLNLGDACLLYMTVTIIKKAFDPDKINILSFDIDNDSNVIDLLNDANIEFLLSPARTSKGNKKSILFEMLLFLCWSIIYRLTGNNSAYLIKNKSAYTALKNSDLIIVRGGDNLADTYGISSLIGHLFNMLLAIILRKKTVVLGTSIGPFKRTSSKRMVLYLLRKIDYVIARDSNSLLLLKNGGLGNVHFIADVAFDLPMESDQNYDTLFNSKNNTSYVGIAASSLISRYLGKDQYTTLMAEVCDMVIAHYGCKVVLIPHVLSYGFNDRDTAEIIFNKINSKDSVTLIHETNPAKVKYIISKLDLLISPRMHPIIHALSTGVPVIGIDYNKKTEELLKLFDQKHWVVGVNEISNLKKLVSDFFTMKVTDKSFYKIKPVSTFQQYVSFLQNLYSKS